MGGGGVSGKVGYPDYIETIHSAWLGSGAITGTTLKATMESALAATPWGGSGFTDPAVTFAAIQTRLDTFETMIATLAPTTNWDSFLDAAVASVDTSGVLTDLDPSAMRTTVQAAVQAQVREALAEVRGKIQEKVEYSLMMQQVKAAITSDVHTNLDVPTLAGSSANQADTDWSAF